MNLWESAEAGHFRGQMQTQ